MLVVDTSAIVGRLIADPPPARLRSGWKGSRCTPPHLIDVEFLHVLRRMVAHRQLTPARADVVRSDF